MKEEDEGSLFEGIDFSMLNEEEPVKRVAKKKVVDPEDEVDDEVEVEKDEIIPSDESENEISSSSSSYQVLAKALSEEGIFSLSEEQLKGVNDAEKIIELVQNEINTRVEEYKNSLPKDVQEILDGWDDGADLDDLVKIKKEQLVFSKIKEEDLADNEELQKKVLRKDFELRGMSSEDIEEEIADIFSLGKEDIKSVRSLKNIIRRTEEETVRLRQEAKVEEQRRQTEYTERVNSIKKSVLATGEIGGVVVSKKIQDDAFKAMTVPIAEFNGNPINAITKSRLENPIEFDKNVAVLWALTDGFKKWDAFGKAAKKRALSELDKVADDMARQKESGTAPIRRSQQLSMGETVLSDIDLHSIK